MPRDVSPLPWRTVVSPYRPLMVHIQDADDHSIDIAVDGENTRLFVDCVNLVGKDLDRPEFADIVKAIGGMDDDALGQLADFLKEKGCMG
jgi:hypothetical protein